MRSFQLSSFSRSMVEHQVILLDREMEGYKKSIAQEQEHNETLTMQLNWSQMDVATSKKLISQKQSQQEALQAHYSTCLRTLRETERTLARLTKVDGGIGRRLLCPACLIIIFLLSVTTPFFISLATLGNQHPPDWSQRSEEAVGEGKCRASGVRGQDIRPHTAEAHPQHGCQVLSAAHRQNNHTQEGEGKSKKM